MKTILGSEKKTVTINTAGSLIIIGEKINPTGRKKIAVALQTGDFDYIRNLAVSQVNAETDALDVNVGVPGLDDVALIAMAFGATCVITDPLKMAGIIRATDLLLGRDDYAGRYLRYYRQAQKALVAEVAAPV